MRLNLENKTCYYVALEFDKGDINLIINGMRTKIEKIEYDKDDETSIHLYNNYNNVLLSIFEDGRGDSYAYDCNLYINNECILDNDIIVMDLHFFDVLHIVQGSNVNYIEL